MNLVCLYYWTLSWSRSGPTFMEAQQSVHQRSFYPKLNVRPGCSVLILANSQWGTNTVLGKVLFWGRSWIIFWQFIPYVSSTITVTLLHLVFLSFLTSCCSQPCFGFDISQFCILLHYFLFLIIILFSFPLIYMFHYCLLLLNLLLFLSWSTHQ